MIVHRLTSSSANFETLGKLSADTLDSDVGLGSFADILQGPRHVPFCPSEQTSEPSSVMSALCQIRTSVAPAAGAILCRALDQDATTCARFDTILPNLIGRR
jgi:hypothetical protein